MVEGTDLMDLVPTLVVQSSCEYAEAATNLLRSVSRDRKKINDCMLSAQRQMCLARVAGLHEASGDQMKTP